LDLVTGIGWKQAGDIRVRLETLTAPAVHDLLPYALFEVGNTVGFAVLHRPPEAFTIEHRLFRSEALQLEP
jgi:hypothetical protein